MLHIVGNLLNQIPKTYKPVIFLQGYILFIMIQLLCMLELDMGAWPIRFSPTPQNPQVSSLPP